MNWYKLAQQRGQYPPQSLPDESERAIRMRKDPYRRRTTDDGEGNKLTTPGSIGMPGEMPDVGVGIAGPNEREGYPKDISMYDKDVDKDFSKIPSYSDTDKPFGEDTEKTEYGQGQDTGYGQALHDDVGFGDSAVGIHDTVMRDLSGGERDRKTDIANMQGHSDSFLGHRRPKPYNRKLETKGPMGFVRDVQQRQAK